MHAFALRRWHVRWSLPWPRNDGWRGGGGGRGGGVAGGGGPFLRASRGPGRGENFSFLAPPPGGGGSTRRRARHRLARAASSRSGAPLPPIGGEGAPATNAANA